MITTDHKKISKKLEERGWKKNHIATTIAIMKKTKKHSPYDRMFFFFTLVFMLIGNCFILIGMLPLILELPLWFILSLLAIVGFSFGFIVDRTVSEHEFTNSHYFLAFIIFPAASVIMIQVIVAFVSKFAGNAGFTIETHTLAMCFSYVLSFVLPHIIRKSMVKRVR